MPDFIPGLQLNEAFYHQAVRPILEAHYPALPYSAALIGDGSDVLGYDTPVSRDHEWGPRLTIFLTPEDLAATAPLLHETLRQELPVSFLGYSTHYSLPDPHDGGVRVRTEIEHGPVEHHIYFDTVTNLFQNTLGVDPSHTLDAAGWLTFSDQRLLTLVSGKVFHDALCLEEARRRFAYYPHDVWLYLLAAQWQLISQEEAFVGRTAAAGDELGSRVITGRLVERLMRLCFLIEKRYAPYSKWFGTAFKRLACSPQMGPLLEGAAAASAYPERERFLAQAYTLAAEMHNALQITPPLETRTRTYSGWHALRGGITDLPLGDPRDTRPFQCIFGGRFAAAILEAIQDPAVRALVPAIGSVSQFMVESSDALQSTAFCRAMKAFLSQEMNPL
jgi:hypothetical protein